jgi:hypothetical protein
MIQQHLFGQPQTEMTSDDYYTPKWLFDALGLDFDLDVASPPGGPPFVPCDRYFTQEDDGLAQEWQGRVWMNPPFSKTGPWVERWLNHGNGIALLPCVKETKWTQTLWNSNAKCVFLNNSPVLFHHGDGTKKIWPIVWLWAIGDENVSALRNIGKVR